MGRARALTCNECEGDFLTTFPDPRSFLCPNCLRGGESYHPRQVSSQRQVRNVRRNRYDEEPRYDEGPTFMVNHRRRGATARHPRNLPDYDDGEERERLHTIRNRDRGEKKKKKKSKGGTQQQQTQRTEYHVSIEWCILVYTCIATLFWDFMKLFRILRAIILVFFYLVVMKPNGPWDVSFNRQNNRLVIY